MPEREPNNLPSVSRGLLRDALNEIIVRYMESELVCPEAYVPPATRELMDFAEESTDNSILDARTFKK